MRARAIMTEESGVVAAIRADVTSSQKSTEAVSDPVCRIISRRIVCCVTEPVPLLEVNDVETTSDVSDALSRAEAVCASLFPYHE